MYPGFPAQHCEQVFLQCVAGWGLGLWRDKDLATTFDEKALSCEALADRDLFREINRILPNSSPMIKAISEGRLKAGDITRSIYAIKHSKYSVHPSISVVRNTGHDGSGENCGITDLFDAQEICTREITFNLAKPIKVSSLDQKWVSTFMGGWFAQVHGWLIFLKFNATNSSSRIFYQGLLKAYGLVFRIRQFVRQI